MGKTEPDRYGGAIQIERKWIAVKPNPDWIDDNREEIVAAGDTKQEVRERLHLLELDPDDYEILATPKNGVPHFL